MLAVSVLFAALMSAVQLALSIYARSPREAQQYITPLYFLTILPALLVQFFNDWSNRAWSYAVPVLNAFFTFHQLLLGTLNWSHLLIAALTSACYASLALWLATALMNREGVIFRV
jgi:sodium transport system permease protein